MRQVVQCMHSGLRGLPLLKTPSPSGDDVPLSPSCPIHPSHPTLNPKSSHSSCTLPTKGIMLMVPRINSSEPHRTWLSPPPTLSAPIQPYLYLLSAPLPPYNPTALPRPPLPAADVQEQLIGAAQNVAQSTSQVLSTAQTSARALDAFLQKM